MLCDEIITENFADGKVRGRSRPGRVRRAGASCKGSVSELRRRAKKYSGERGKMYHWCANMKSGKKKVNESRNDFTKLQQALEDFLPLAMRLLDLKHIPKIKIVPVVDNTKQPTFGVFNGTSIRLGINNRHPVDICRTLAHELVHWKQKQLNQLKPDSGVTGSREENQANSQAGIIMREFNREFPHHLEQ